MPDVIAGYPREDSRLAIQGIQPRDLYEEEANIS
jgi:hypothetical protein